MSVKRLGIGSMAGQANTGQRSLQVHRALRLASITSLTTFTARLAAISSTAISMALTGKRPTLLAQVAPRVTRLLSQEARPVKKYSIGTGRSSWTPTGIQPAI